MCNSVYRYRYGHTQLASGFKISPNTEHNDEIITKKIFQRTEIS